MRPRAHQRNLVVWSSSVGWADMHGAPGLTQFAHAKRIHRFVRTSALLTVIGLMRLARAVRPRWRPLLGGGYSRCGLGGTDHMGVHAERGSALTSRFRADASRRRAQATVDPRLER
jgi:hypothetical protein